MRFTAALLVDAPQQQQEEDAPQQQQQQVDSCSEQRQRLRWHSLTMAPTQTTTQTMVQQHGQAAVGEAAEARHMGVPAGRLRHVAALEA